VVQSQSQIGVKIYIEDVRMGSKAEDDGGHRQKQMPTATVHMKITDPATTPYADKGYSSQASVRVRSFTFVSLSSCSESHVFVFVTSFLRFTIPFVALSRSFVRSTPSPPTFVSQPIFASYPSITIFIATHTILSSSRPILSRPFSYAFPFPFPALQILLIMIPLI